MMEAQEADQETTIENLRHELGSVIAGFREFGNCVYQQNQAIAQKSVLFFLSLEKLERTYLSIPKRHLPTASKTLHPNRKQR